MHSHCENGILFINNCYWGIKMFRRMKNTAVLFFCLLFVCGCAKTDEPASSAFSEGIYHLIGSQKGVSEDFFAGAGSSYNDWAAIALCAAGETKIKEKYLNALENYVTNQYQTLGGLNARKATEYHRVALTVLSLGGDPRQFGYDQNGQPADLVADGIWRFNGGDVGMQGVNGWIYALIVLDACGWTIPETELLTRKDIVRNICQNQHDDGAWGLSPDIGDPDITAMALQALHNDQEDAAAAAAIESGFLWLQSAQAEDWTFENMYGVSSESISQVILALVANGIDPQKDDRFLKNGKDPIAVLCEYQLPDGSFCHILDEKKGDLLATAEAVIALCAYERFINSGKFIFDFT